LAEPDRNGEPETTQYPAGVVDVAANMLTSTAALPERHLVPVGEVSAAFRARGCHTFRDAAGLLWNLPYGRNADRADYRLVLVEGRGTCSTKHALLAALAIEQRIAIELRLGIYQMTDANTPGVGRVLERAGLPSIPEAHCWLRHLGVDVDVTMPPGLPAVARSFLHEETIGPDQIGAYKARVPVLSYRIKWLVNINAIPPLAPATKSCPACRR